MNHPILYTSIVVVYVLVMLGIGLWCMRRTNSVGDFFLGGRTLGPWMSAFAYGTTYFSAVLFIGYAGKLGWQFGIGTLWIVLGNTFIGCLLAWYILAARTREMTGRLGALTMPEFLRTRYNSKTMQICGAIAVFVFLVPYSASVYMGLSYLFENTLHIGYNTALIFLAVLTGVYLIIGGYFAVALSDFLRGIVEFVGVLLMMVLLANMKGGLASTFTHLQSLDFMPALKPVAATAPHVTLSGIFASLIPGAKAPPFPGWMILLSLVLITSFGPWAMPQMVQKFYSIRGKADVRRAMIIATTFALFMSFGAYYCGALTHLFYSTGLPADLPLGANGKPNLDYLMPYFITHTVEPWLVMIILLMVFSASMSSLSSLVLVSSSAIAIDIYGALSKEHGQKQIMPLMRVLCAVFVALSLYIAVQQPAVIVNLMAMAWGALSGAFLGPFLYGLFWKRTTRAGAFAGMISGISIAVFLFFRWGQAAVPVAAAIAMIVPMIVVPVVSLMTPAPDPKLVEKAFGQELAETGKAAQIVS